MAPDTTQIRTRSMSHNRGDVGLQLDEDNVLVVSDDEDETSQSSCNASDSSEIDNISLGSDTFDP